MSTKNTPQLMHQDIAGFKIWYDNGTFYTSNDGLWNNAPVDGVQVVMIYFQVKDALGRFTRLYSSGCDYYALDTNGHLTSDFDDIGKVSGHVLYGKFMNYQDLIVLEKDAFNDYGNWLMPKPIEELVK